METICFDNASYAMLEALPLKRNLLKKCPLPELLDANGKPFAPKSGSIEKLSANRLMCDRQHVQLLAPLPLTVTYQLNQEESIKSLLVSTYAGGKPDYGYGRYEVYLSNDREELYSPEHLVGKYDRRKRPEDPDFRPGTAQIFTLEAAASFSYFGIKFTHGCALDSVVRLDLAGAFAECDPAELEALQRLGTCLTEAVIPTSNSEWETYCFGKRLEIDSLLVQNPDSPIEAAAQPSGDFVPLSLPFAETTIGNSTRYGCDTPVVAAAIRCKPGNLIGAFSKTTRVKILPDQVINPHFLGVGTNVLPMMLMEESLAAGYDPAFLKLEQEAIRTLRPDIIRVWFQNDWFQTAPDTYDFTQPRMQAFLEYMSVFRELQTEIELDFSFTVGSVIQKWFSIPEVKDQGRSAPRDIRQFARSVVAALQYLCDEQGFNVKYITLSNEPLGPNFAVNGDMNAKKEYYAATVREMDAALRAANMRDRFEIWGPEDSYFNDYSWLTDIHRLAGDVIDRYSEHIYFSENDALQNEIFPTMKELVEQHPICLTEFGNRQSAYQKSNIGCLIEAVNCGLDAALQWCLTNAILADPLTGGAFDEEICLYRNQDFKNEALQIEKICAEYGPAMRYIPAHSRVLKAEISNPNDLRLAVFEKDGDVTVLIETNKTGTRELCLDLSGLTHKPLQKISYNIDTNERPNTLLTAGEPVLLTDGKLTEQLAAEHRMILYTTLR